MDERVKKIVENSRNIVFFGGAGVSTESNIPDFRSETGLYHAQQEYGYAPEEMLSHTFFVRNMKTFFDYYKRHLIYLDAKPNQAHLALAKLEACLLYTSLTMYRYDKTTSLAGGFGFAIPDQILLKICLRGYTQGTA